MSLPRPDEELARVGARARERTLDEHTGERRANELLRWMDEAAYASNWNHTKLQMGAGSAREVRS